MLGVIPDHKLYGAYIPICSLAGTQRLFVPGIQDREFECDYNTGDVG